MSKKIRFWDTFTAACELDADTFVYILGEVEYGLSFGFIGA
jgi:hypothetical protein